MKLIIGLGNPGEKYENTRHNIGFKIVDEIRKKFGFSDFLQEKKLLAQISTGEIANQKIILAKPQTFMNESGKSAAKIIKFYYFNAGADSLFVIHDDSDIELGKIKISRERGSGGHKGVESIIKEIKNKNFIRFRIGVRLKKETGKAEKFILKKFGLAEKLLLEKTIKNSINAVILSITENPEKAMNEYNK